ncbi:hypothetical protein S245_066667, partial [Arachis hypogaea]
MMAATAVSPEKHMDHRKIDAGHADRYWETKMLSVPIFRKDGNPFNTSVIPSPAAAPSPTAMALSPGKSPWKAFVFLCCGTLSKGQRRKMPRSKMLVSSKVLYINLLDTAFEATNRKEFFVGRYEWKDFSEDGDAESEDGVGTKMLTLSSAGDGGPAPTWLNNVRQQNFLHLQPDASLARNDDRHDGGDSSIAGEAYGSLEDQCWTRRPMLGDTILSKKRVSARFPPTLSIIIIGSARNLSFDVLMSATTLPPHYTSSSVCVLVLRYRVNLLGFSSIVADSIICGRYTSTSPIHISPFNYNQKFYFVLSTSLFSPFCLSTGKLAFLAILVSGKIVLQILACALYNNWWPMLSAITYVLLPMPLLFFMGSNGSFVFSESDS